MRKPIAFLLIATLAGLTGATSAIASSDWEQAVAAYKAGNNAKAIEAFTRYVERVPDAYQGHQMLGTVLLRGGEATKAVAHLRRAEELEPGQPAIRLTLSKALLKSGQTADACAVLDSVESATLPASYLKTLFGLRAAAECGDGLSDLHKLAETTNTAQAWASYGVAAQRAEDYATAVEALGKAGKLAPSDAKIRRAEALAGIALAQKSSGEDRLLAYSAAVVPAKVAYTAALEKAKASATTIDPKTTWLYAETLVGGRELEKAATVLDAGLATSPGERSLNHLRGRVFVLQSNYKDALAPLEAALGAAKTAAESNDTLKQLGFAYEKLRRYDDAIVAYQKLGSNEDVARAEANKAIAIENEKADEFNRERDKFIKQQREMEAELDKVRAGGPPPTPN